MSYAPMLQRIADCDCEGAEFRLVCMQTLAEIEGFDWCGVYRLQGETLVLDAYVGAPTDHTHIPVGKGVCGTAVAQNENQIVDDVRNLQNYLSCSLETRSELVVLIRDALESGNILGQIDIDGHTVGRFGKPEEHLLEAVAALIAERW